MLLAQRSEAGKMTEFELNLTNLEAYEGLPVYLLKPPKMARFSPKLGSFSKDHLQYLHYPAKNCPNWPDLRHFEHISRPHFFGLTVSCWVKYSYQFEG